jgi:hypothetical protein
MKNSEPNIYGGLATIRNGYMQMQWGRVQMYLVFNTVALPIAYKSDTEGTTKLIVGIIGILVSLFIPIAIIRGNWWTKFFNQKLAKLEQLDGDSEQAPRVFAFSDEDFVSFSERKTASRKLFAPVAVIVFGLWIWLTTHQLLLTSPFTTGWNWLARVFSCSS